MQERPCKCPLCHSAFKGEGGMKWHLVHRHEIPAAFDALGKEYGEKAAVMHEENASLKQKVDKLQQELNKTNIELINETTEKLSVTAQLMGSNNLLRRAAFAVFTRDSLIKERLGMDLPNPFEQKD